MQEFDVAFHHNIMVKHKKRLVILMALDSPTDFLASDTSDTAVLRQYLRQYTYIDYTADDWLDNLLYALPLRGLLQRNQDGMNNQAVEDEEHPGNHQDTDALLIDPFQGEEQPYLNDEGADVLMLR